MAFDVSQDRDTEITYLFRDFGQSGFRHMVEKN